MGRYPKSFGTPVHPEHDGHGHYPGVGRETPVRCWPDVGCALRWDHQVVPVVGGPCLVVTEYRPRLSYLGEATRTAAVIRVRNLDRLDVSESQFCLVVAGVSAENCVWVLHSLILSDEQRRTLSKCPVIVPNSLGQIGVSLGFLDAPNASLFSTIAE